MSGWRSRDQSDSSDGRTDARHLHKNCSRSTSVAESMFSKEDGLVLKQLHLFLIALFIPSQQCLYTHWNPCSAEHAATIQAIVRYEGTCDFKPQVYSSNTLVGLCLLTWQQFSLNMKMTLNQTMMWLLGRRSLLKEISPKYNVLYPCYAHPAFCEWTYVGTYVAIAKNHLKHSWIQIVKWSPPNSNRMCVSPFSTSPENLIQIRQ